MHFAQLPIVTGLFICMAQGQRPLPDQVPIDTPYVASPEHIVDVMLRVAKVGSRDTVYDLGCGDGRIVIAAAKSYGARGVGVDNNPLRIEEARVNARHAGVVDRVNFELKDLFDADIRHATVVAIYLLPDVNLRLRDRLLQELEPGTRIVSHSFAMGDWKPDQELMVDGDHVYLWIVPNRKTNSPS